MKIKNKVLKWLFLVEVCAFFVCAFFAILVNYLVIWWGRNYIKNYEVNQ